MSDYITSVFDMTLLILSFVIFVISLLEMKNSNIIKSVFLDMIFQNDMKRPIMSIEMVRNICDEDNEFTYMFESYFEGIQGGSYRSVNNTVKPCSNNDKDCMNVQTIPRTPLRAWYDKVICVKRLEVNESNFNVAKSKEDCQEGFKLCGIYNSYGDKYCLNKTYECPISYIRFTTDRNDIRDLDLKIYNYITLDYDQYLIFSNKVNDTEIPIDFQISENYPCLDIGRISYNESFPYFPTMNNSMLMGCKSKVNGNKDIIEENGYDERYHIQATEIKGKVLTDNDLSNRYFKLPKLNGWKNDYKNNTFNIFSRGYISLNYSCANYESFKDFKLNLERLKLTLFNQLVISLSNVIVLLIFISVLSLFKLFSSWIKLFIRFMKICGSTLFLLYVFYRIKISQIIISDIEKHVRVINKCGDKYMIEGLKIYDMDKNLEEFKKLENVMGYFGIISGVTIGILLICLIFKIYVRLKNTKRRKIANQELGNASTSYNNDTTISPFKIFKGIINNKS